jgi:hypothetical protein
MNDVREMPGAIPGEGERCDLMFQAIIAADDLRSVDAAGDREGLRRDVRRIASTVFCSADIDPSIVTFAKHRAALHWGLTEPAVDVMVTARLLQKAASLSRDLRWLGPEQPRGVPA